MKSLIFISVILAGLGFAGYKTAPTTSAPIPLKQETQQTIRTSPSTPSESTESVQPGALEKSNTSRTTLADATEPQTRYKKDTKKKSQISQTVSADETETRTGETDRPTTQSKLEKARDDLRIGLATEKRIASELEQLNKSGDVSAEDIGNYEAYLERVRAMVAENRKTLEKMEGAYARHFTGSGASEVVDSESKKLSDPAIPEEQHQDKLAELDRQLSASLNDFDAMLLKEIEAIETASVAKMRDLAREAAEAAKRLKEKGVELNTGESESSEDASKQDEKGGDDTAAEKQSQGEKDASGKKKGSDTQDGKDDEAIAYRDQSMSGGSGTKGDRGSRYSKEDDDIVARQLREAAENETDPELKEKLWKEYEDYKKNTQQ